MVSISRYSLSSIKGSPLYNILGGGGGVSDDGGRRGGVEQFWREGGFQMRLVSIHLSS